MRSVVAAAIIALLSVTAYAQGFGGGRHHGRGAKSGEHKKKATESSGKSPLEALPDKPYDPWRTVREAPPAKK